MKAIILYDSWYGNTEKLALSLARGLQSKGVYVETIKVNQFEGEDLNEFDFIAVGGPTHIAGLSKPMKKFLKTVRGSNFQGKMGFAFDTRIESKFNVFDINSAARRIEAALRRMKVKIIYPRESVLVEGREGPLVGESEAHFLRLGTVIAERLSEIQVASV